VPVDAALKGRSSTGASAVDQGTRNPFSLFPPAENVEHGLAAPQAVTWKSGASAPRQSAPLGNKGFSPGGRGRLSKNDHQP
ncbi:MAG: hypothetical protein ABSE40_20705, partial [Candidatus Sulfotelmatobacter sp.]